MKPVGWIVVDARMNEVCPPGIPATMLYRKYRYAVSAARVLGPDHRALPVLVQHRPDLTASTFKKPRPHGRIR